MSFAQGKISLSVKNVDLQTLLVEIEKKSDIRFSYLNRLSDTHKDISLTVTNETVEDILGKVLPLKGMEFTRTGNTIAIQAKASQSKPAVPTKKISGTVTDSNGEPIIGANVSVKGTTTGTITDVDGRFSLDAAQGQIILVSYIGYSPKEIQISNQTSYAISMSEDSLNLEEVIVVGYGTMKKSDLTGSISNIKSDKLLNRPVTNITQSLQGKVAGVEVFQNSGAPGGHVRMRIRGDNSIKSSNEPLYVVDGIIGVTSELLNPNDIESIEVLKDASATAIYGARGANGVVLVTTKRGLKGKPLISYEGYMAIGTPAKKIDVLNSSEFMQIYNSLYENAKKYDPKGYAEGKYANRNLPSTYPNLFDANGNPLYDTDWQDEAYRTAISHNHQISMRGGTDNTTYGLFLSYKDENGWNPHSNDIVERLL